MARHEGDFRTSDGKPLDFEELLALLERTAPAAAHELESARICYLSSSDGWRDAAKQIGGAFAGDIAALTESKGE